MYPGIGPGFGKQFGMVGDHIIIYLIYILLDHPEPALEILGLPENFMSTPS